MARFIFFLAVVFLIVSIGAAGARPSDGRVGIKLQVPEKFRKGAFRAERTLEAPRGFKVSVFAAGLDGPRFMAFDKYGRLFVTLPSSGEVVALPDDDKDGVADRVVTFARGLERPHGIAFTDDGVAVAGSGSLVLLRDADNDLAAEKKEVISGDIPAGGVHWTRTVVIGPDGRFHVSAGSSCNACVEDDKRRASVMVIKDGKAGIYASGLRNTVGMAFHPATGELWGVDNGRDMLGDDIPPEELNMINEGEDYGWPYCYGDRRPDPEFGSMEKCKNTVPPVVKMQAHSAPLGVAFGYGLKFPKGFKDALFVAFHGSWNRTVPTGYKLVSIPFEGGRPSGGPVDFITGWLVKGSAWGRPVAPVAGKDGALYLSDDEAGAVYRITAE